MSSASRTKWPAGGSHCRSGGTRRSSAHRTTMRMVPSSTSRCSRWRGIPSSNPPPRPCQNRGSAVLKGMPASSWSARGQCASDIACTGTPAHQHTSTPAHQHTSMPACQHQHSTPAPPRLETNSSTREPKSDGVHGWRSRTQGVLCLDDQGCQLREHAVNHCLVHPVRTGCH